MTNGHDHDMLYLARLQEDGLRHPLSWTSANGGAIASGLYQNMVFESMSSGGAGMQNAYSPDRLTRDQLKKLLSWDAPSSHITREMMVVAVKNRLSLGRLSLEDIAAA